MLTAQARRELAEAVRWIAREEPAAARGLRDAVIQAAQRIARHPDIGVVRDELAPLPVRFVPLPRYRYALVYESRQGGLPVILRVVHGAMDLPEVLAGLRRPAS
ncbi:MAG: type II toxin-antitoxin system RelE/ParE family toxin [Roseomonas sp.]|nr:type II toxin-antitoxin system RelE/ParE family toxin [Roseomonas sp.]